MVRWTLPRTILLVALFYSSMTPSCGAQGELPTASFVEAEPGVKIEVLDWGGSGPPLVLLAGLGATAKSFNSFALALRPAAFHVYGATRRGYGNSGAPVPNDENYSADRLGDDVLAVIDQLHLNKPLLVGHSLAGEELSSIGSRRPERVAGLVYLDAGYRYALSGPGMNDLQIDMVSMRRYLKHALDDIDPTHAKGAVEDFLRELPAFETELRNYGNALGAAPPTSQKDRAEQEAERKTSEGRAERAILDGEQRYGVIRCPLLVFFAYPHKLSVDVPAGVGREREKSDMEFADQRASLFRAQKNARVILLPNAEHAVQDSNRAEVIAEIKALAARVGK